MRGFDRSDAEDQNTNRSSIMTSRRTTTAQGDDDGGGMEAQQEVNNDNNDSGAAEPAEAESDVRPSLSVKLIRHAESSNNQVYRDARFLYRGGTPEFDEEGWNAYVNEHRMADPGLSETGSRQAKRLAAFLVPHLTNQAEHPVNVIVSPMRRTCETIQPTLAGLLRNQKGGGAAEGTDGCGAICNVLSHGFYFESEGCHTNEEPEEGMNRYQIRRVLYPDVDASAPPPLDFVGFPYDDPDRGWYDINGRGSETRAESERRAARFYLWLCEYLDRQLLHRAGVFDAGVRIQGEEGEDEHDKAAPRLRRRRTVCLIGHGDFMSLVLKRIVAGFGHAVESPGVPHRSAFVHWNTGITELEYFGKGRFLVMSQNSTPHLTPDLLTGGSLKDGWSFLMPNDAKLLNAEVSVAFSDEELDDHVVEQRDALKALYLSSEESDKLSLAASTGDENYPSVDQEENAQDRKLHVRHFIVKHGHQVVATATYSEATGKLSDVAVRPSAGSHATEALLDAVKQHSRRLGRSGSLLVQPRSPQSRTMFAALGFQEVEEESEHMELKH